MVRRRASRARSGSCKRGVERSAHELVARGQRNRQARRCAPLRYPAGARASKHPQRCRELRREIHLNREAGDDYESSACSSTPVASAAMKMLNALQDLRAAQPRMRARAAVTGAARGLSILLRVLSPIAPHIATRCGRSSVTARDLIDRAVARVDPAALEQDEIELVLQVNGKLRGHMRVPQRRPRGDRAAGARATTRCAEAHRRPAAEESDRRARPAGQHRGLVTRHSGEAGIQRGPGIPGTRLARRICSPARFAVLAVAGCGFQLRGQQASPSNLYVPVNTPLGRAEAQHRRRERPDARSSPTPGDARRVLPIITERAGEGISRSTPQGRVTEYQLRYRVALPRVDARRASTTSRPPRSLLTRDITYNDRGARQGDRGSAALRGHAGRHRAADPAPARCRRSR